MLHTLVLAAIVNGIVILRHQSLPDERAGAVLIELSQGQEVEQVVATAMTASDGTFTFPEVAPGRYSIRITANYGGASGAITVPAEAGDAPRTFYLFDPGCGGKYGRVRDKVSGEPVAEAWIYYLNETYSSANGDYFMNFGCFSGPGFQFHNSFFYGVRADGYRPISIFGGRGESVHVVGGSIVDWNLTPVRPPGVPPQDVQTEPERR